MSIEEQTVAFSNRIQEFEQKLFEMEQVLMKMCSRTEAKIDLVLTTLNDIHDIIINRQEDEKSELYDESGPEDEGNGTQSDSESEVASTEHIDR